MFILPPALFYFYVQPHEKFWRTGKLAHCFVLYWLVIMKDMIWLLFYFKQLSVTELNESKAIKFAPNLEMGWETKEEF